MTRSLWMHLASVQSPCGISLANLDQVKNQMPCHECKQLQSLCRLYQFFYPLLSFLRQSIQGELQRFNSRYGPISVILVFLLIGSALQAKESTSLTSEQKKLRLLPGDNSIIESQYVESRKGARITTQMTTIDARFEEKSEAPFVSELEGSDYEVAWFSVPYKSRLLHELSVAYEYRRYINTAELQFLGETLVARNFQVYKELILKSEPSIRLFSRVWLTAQLGFYHSDSREESSQSKEEGQLNFMRNAIDLSWAHPRYLLGLNFEEKIDIVEEGISIRRAEMLSMRAGWRPLPRAFYGLYYNVERRSTFSDRVADREQWIAGSEMRCHPLVVCSFYLDYRPKSKVEGVPIDFDTLDLIGFRFNISMLAYKNAALNVRYRYSQGASEVDDASEISIVAQWVELGTEYVF